MRRNALAVAFTLFALTLLSAMFAFSAEKQHKWERGKVIAQNLSSSPAGVYAAPEKPYTTPSLIGHLSHEDQILPGY